MNEQNRRLLLFVSVIILLALLIYESINLHKSNTLVFYVSYGIGLMFTLIYWQDPKDFKSKVKNHEIKTMSNSFGGYAWIFIPLILITSKVLGSTDNGWMLISFACIILFTPAIILYIKRGRKY